MNSRPFQLRALSRPLQERRGAALLLVLGVLVLLMASLAPLARLAGVRASTGDVAPRRELLDELLPAADLATIEWLNTKSMRVALPLDTPSPSVTILNDVMHIDGKAIYLQLTAFDQLGMVPLTSVERDGLLTMSLSDDAVDAARWLKGLRDPSPGLDLLAAARRGVRVFPLAHASEATHFGDARQGNVASDQPAQSFALGEQLATHPQLATAPSTARININTAPRALLNAAVLSAGRGDLSAIERSREQGRPFTMNASTSSPRSSPSTTAMVELVSFSNCWAIRTDLAVDHVHQCWWSVYIQTGSTWSRVQRLAITE